MVRSYVVFQRFIPCARSAYILTTIIACLLAGRPVLAQSNPVAMYGLNEGTGTVVGDASGNGNNGATTATTWTTGKYGQALSFNGTSSFVTIPDTPSLDLTTGTVEVWFRRSSTGGWRALVAKGSANNNNVPNYFLMFHPSNRLVFGVGNGTASNTFTTSATFTDTTNFHHLAMTWDGTSVRLYYDGVLLQTNPQTVASAANTAPLYLGQFGGNVDRYSGLIDEVRIYNRALTASEIQTDMSTPVPPPQPDNTAPSVSVTAPTGGATVSGTVTLSANASDNVAVAGVQFFVNGNTVGSEDTTSPYQTTWDTTAVPNGSAYQITARARDSSGNQTLSEAVTVSVNNAPPPPDTTPPSVSVTAPTGGATVVGTVTLSASASDNVAVAGVQFFIDGAVTGAEDTTAPYQVSWNTTAVSDGTHQSTARARDAAGNQTLSAPVAVSVNNTAPPPTPGLVSAYALNEGTGTAVADASGSANNGTATATTWTTGKYGQALSFNGTTSFVTFPDSASLDLTAGTVELWFRRSATGGWRSLMAKGNANNNNVHNYFLMFQPDNRLMFGIGNGTASNTFLTTATFTDTANFHHLAMTWDGTSVRVYYDGALLQTNPQTVAAGGNTAALYLGQFGGNVDRYLGIIDEVRIYNRALTLSEIQNDMNTPISGTAPPPDTTGPTVSVTAPSSGATVSGTTTLSANASDNVAVVGVQFLVNGSAVGAEDTTSPYQASWDTTAVPNGSSYQITARARDAAGNQTLSPAVTVSVNNAPPPPDTTPPAVSVTTPSGGATVSGTVALAATASDNVAVAGVQFFVNGAAVGPEDTSAPYGVNWDTTSVTDGGPYQITARARDAAANQTLSAAVSVSVNNTSPPPTQLVSEYGFNEGSGSAVADTSGVGNHGTATGTTWTTGKYGQALSFNGTSSYVTVPDSASLDIVTGTVEAWFKLGVLGTWRSLMAKGGVNNSNSHNYFVEFQPDNRLHYGIGGNAFTTTNAITDTTSFHHVAMTWDGTSVRLYLDGALVQTSAQTVAAAPNIAPLYIGQFGGDADRFSGIIDEVRIYQRVLSLAEIQADMNRPAGGGDTTPPTVSMTAPANGSTLTGIVTLAANASDNAVVAGVQFLLDGSPIGVEDTTAPYSISWNSSSASNGAHTLSARARDASGNQTVSAVVNVSVSNSTTDTVAPTVTMTAPANGATVSGSVTVSANASDNIGVAGVQFLLDGAPIGTEDTTAPYSILWDSSGAAAGAHTLSARARDAAGNQTTSTGVSITVSPAGFQDVIVLSGLVSPTVVQFASDGRIFIAEKSGIIKVYDNLADTSPTVFADLTTNVYNFWDRGLLGMALHPEFPATPYVYVLYTYDAAIGGTAPRWGTAGVPSDPCPSPPGATQDGCVVSGRLSRLTASGNVSSGPEAVLIEDWCQQYPSHSIGTLAFGPDGALYVSAGEGAAWSFTDYGQRGNPCGDPPGPTGSNLTAPTAEGGSLRSQDLRTAGDPVTLDGSILRLDPNTGLALPTNPLAANSDVNARRIVAHGFRNPFRFTIRPGTNELWIGDVGANDWEEINRIEVPTSGVLNFGWPCYEASGRHQLFDNANLSICENLYASASAVTNPFFAYRHGVRLSATDTCALPAGSSSISGLAFYNGGTFPAQYNDALFFADYSRDCIFVMVKGANGLPDPGTVTTFRASADSPVELKVGPGGDLFYASFDGGTLRRITYSSGNGTPTAVATANPTSGPVPLTVQFSGTGSTDPDAGDTLSYSWDLNGDGTFGDSASAQPVFTYNSAGTYSVRLRVTDNRGATNTSAPLTINAGNTPPVATIQAPVSTTTWSVGETIAFSGSASDAEQGTLPASAFTWTFIIHHCPSTCHTHVVQDIAGVTSGTLTAPDHDYPSHLELRLTVRDNGGLQDVKSVMLQPNTVTLSLASVPSGLQLTAAGQTSATPFSRTVIRGSFNTVSAVSPQTLNGTIYQFVSWSDGGAQTHSFVASDNASVTATYTASNPPPSGLVLSIGFNEGSGTVASDSSGSLNNGTISGATWSASGKFGPALAFNGSNSWVTVNDSASLDLTTGMTLEAWVNPATATGWRTVMLKEQSQQLVYALYANTTRTNAPSGHVFTTSDMVAQAASPLPVNSWSHLAVTYNGSIVRLYVNGTEVANRAATGSIQASAGPLRIGGNAIWPEYFSGLIDEVRVYNRALTAAEIQTDMNTPLP